MPEDFSRIAALDALHLRYDGPVPKRDFVLAESGGPEDLVRNNVRSDLKYWRTYLRDGIRAYRNADTAECRHRAAADIRHAWPLYRRAISRKVDIERRLCTETAQRQLWHDLWKIAG